MKILTYQITCVPTPEDWPVETICTRKPQQVLKEIAAWFTVVKARNRDYRWGIKKTKITVEIVPMTLKEWHQERKENEE